MDATPIATTRARAGRRFLANSDRLDLTKTNAAYRRGLGRERMTGGNLLPAADRPYSDFLGDAERLDAPENLLTTIVGPADRAG